MTLEFLDQWIAALRSGAFTQIRGSLRMVKSGRGECFCALGVGMEVLCSQNPAFIEKGERVGYIINYYQYEDYEFNGIVPTIPNSGFIEDAFDEDLATEIALLNDDSEYSFEKIAIYLDTFVRERLNERLARRGEKTKEAAGEEKSPNEETSC